jgi:CDP-diacylglycerol--glycerol-3-phosphate 3-phosphatidyltransferase
MKRIIVNTITSIRIFSLPILFWKLSFFQLEVFIIINGFNDYLDGYLSRKWKVESKIGAFYDQLADKIFFNFVCYFYYIQLVLPFWFLILSILRDLIILTMRVTYKNSKYQVNFVGKVKTLIQFLFLILVGVIMNYCQNCSILVFILCIFILFVSYYSLLKYLYVKK